MAILGGGQISCGLLPDVVATGAAISDKMGELVQNFVARPKGGVVMGTRDYGKGLPFYQKGILFWIIVCRIQ